MGADMGRLTVFCLWLMGTALRAQPSAVSRPDLNNTTAVEMTPPAPNQSVEPQLPFTTDTQVRVMGLYEPVATNNSVTPAPSVNPETPYLAIEGVPLRAVFRLLARRSGLNYLEPQEDQLPEEEITLQMTEPKPLDRSPSC